MAVGERISVCVSVRLAVRVCVCTVYLLRKHAQPCYWLDPEQQQPGSAGQQDYVTSSNYCCLGIVKALDLDTERLSFQEGKEYKQQQSILEKNMEKMSKGKK